MAYTNNFGTARQLFADRSFYNRRWTSRYPEYIDFRDKRYFYGRVNLDFDAVTTNLEKLREVRQSGASVLVFDFVADAFEAMQQYIAEAALATNGSRIDETFLYNMRAVSGWVSPHLLYNKYMENNQILFATHYLNENNRQAQVSNIDEYIDTFFRFYNELDYPFPLTKSNFTLSGYVPPSSSGLCVEIDNADHSADAYKVQEYYSQPMFKDYVKIARRFGFVIDKSAPWRLVANLASPIMMNYMKHYDVADQKTFFEEYYEKCYEVDIEALKVHFINGYNRFVAAFPTYSVPKTVCSDGRQKIISQEFYRKRVIYMPNLPLDHHLQPKVKAIWNSFWLRKYYVMRYREAGMTQSPVLQKASIKRVEVMEKNLDILTAVRYITDRTKTTYRRYTLPPPHERSISGVVECCNPDEDQGPRPEGEWRLGPVQGGTAPRLVPANTPTDGGTD